MMKIIRIIKSKFKNKNKLLNEKWYSDRVNTCLGCEFNSHRNKQRGVFAYIWDLIVFKKIYCTVCKCPIMDKASEEMEECPKNKWKK